MDRPSSSTLNELSSCLRDITGLIFLFAMIFWRLAATEVEVIFSKKA